LQERAIDRIIYRLKGAWPVDIAEALGRGRRS
jgi:hypothetical protein